MNNRILGLIGSALLILGIFLPIVSVMGLINFSYFDLIRLDTGTFFTGIILLLLGIGSLLLSLKNMYKALIATGVVSLALLAFDFFRIKSAMSEGASTGGGTGAQMAEAASIGWGLYIMLIAAILLIVAGVMKSSAPTGPAYGAPPPPPYPPAR